VYFRWNVGLVLPLELARVLELRNELRSWGCTNAVSDSGAMFERELRLVLERVPLLATHKVRCP